MNGAFVGVQGNAPIVTEVNEPDHTTLVIRADVAEAPTEPSRLAPSLDLHGHFDGLSVALRLRGQLLGQRSADGAQRHLCDRQNQVKIVLGDLIRFAKKDSSWSIYPGVQGMCLYEPLQLLVQRLVINLVDNANLDGMRFSPFGKGVEGMDVVDAITAAADAENPTDPVVLTSATVATP